MTEAQFNKNVGMVFAISLLAPFPLAAQIVGDFIEIKVALNATNIVRSVPAVSVSCSVESSIVSSVGPIGTGQTALFFNGDPEDFLTFDPREDEFKFTQVIAADREATPSEITVKILPVGNIPLDAWTKGQCSFGLFDPEEYNLENFTPSSFWELGSYASARGCEDVNPNLLYSCVDTALFSSSDSNPDAHPKFVRPGYESD